MAQDMANDGRSKGAIIKLFGVALIFVGLLDCMLSWRAGVELSTLYLVLIAAGVLFYAIGAIRRSGTVSHLTELHDD